MINSNDYSLAELENGERTFYLTIDEQISELAEIIISLLIKEMIKTERESDNNLGRDAS